MPCLSARLEGEAAVVDTWWMTETGGFLGSTLPALQPMKPGSCGPGVLGVHPVIYDEDGNVVEAGSGTAGNICIRNPWPGVLQTVWGQPDRFVDIYYRRYCRDPDSTDWRDWPFLCGDGAVQAADGYFRILGRIGDVINVAGHRLGTKELESATLTVAEAAAVPVMDELRGRAVEMYVALNPGLTPSPEIEQKVAAAIEHGIGKIARPRNVWIVPDMPKTRSGKIMRRVIAGISNFADVGDITTLANPEIVDDIRQHVPEREARPRRRPPRALHARSPGDPVVRKGRVALRAARTTRRLREKRWVGMRQIHWSHSLSGCGVLRAVHGAGVVRLFGEADGATREQFVTALESGLARSRASRCLVVDLTQLHFIDIGCASDLLLLAQRATRHKVIAVHCDAYRARLLRMLGAQPVRPLVLIEVSHERRPSTARPGRTAGRFGEPIRP
ncbi:AMP-binding protein [Streptomyces sp. NBC_01262]